MFYRQINRKIAAVCILLILGSLTTVFAQQSSTLAGGSPGMNYSRVLLKRPDVQRELRLDSRQKDSLARMLNQTPGEIAARAVRFMPPVKYVDITKLSREERRKWQEEIGRQSAAQAVKFMEEQRREVEEVLRPDQLKRLLELDLQWRGILALVDRNVSDKIKISPEQRERISQIVADFEVKRIGLLGEDENANSPIYRQRQELLRETEKKVLTLLSDQEKARWKQAIGEPFDFQ